MQLKRVKRAIDGLLLLDKPLGYSSNQALQQVKRLYQAAKAGHTGSLDPLATGLLPVCLGEATKFSHFLLDADKSYRALIQLGSTTTTGDAEGEVLTRAQVNVSPALLQETLSKFVGPIEQVPPMYSALKHQGKALYEYAREGQEVARLARLITIFDIKLNNFDQASNRAEIDVVCSKGTYIRTLAEDIGQALGCGAHLAGLRRLTTAHFSLQNAYTLEQLEAMSLDERDEALLPVESSVQDLPSVELDDDSAYYLLQGQSVWKSGFKINGLFRIYQESGRFLGLGELDADGKVAPKRLLAMRD
jgi:tRNA pseudouridine55 synthase